MKATILVAEDDRNLRRVLRAMLVREGYDVAEGPDGEAASAWLAGHRADALITDIRMPRMDGLALFRQVRERHPDVPVILITAYGTICVAGETPAGRRPRPGGRGGGGARKPVGPGWWAADRLGEKPGR